MKRSIRSSSSLLAAAVVAPLLAANPSSAWVANAPPSMTSMSPRTNTPLTVNPILRPPSLFPRMMSSTASSSTTRLLATTSEDTARDFSLEAASNANSDYAETTKRVNDLALLNGSIVAFLAFGALYSLLHVDVEALVALYTYDLGPHSSELTKAAVAMDLLARLPMDAIRAYEGLIPTNPIFYKACTSGVAYALGDFISQVYQGKTLETLDLPRAGRSGAAGFLCHGPLCHYWLLFMETYLDFNGAWWATGIKVTADLTVWSIFLNAAYSTIIGVLAGRKIENVLADVKLTLWPALRTAWTFWPWVHTVSFSHAVPLDLKLLWVDVMEIVWVTMLSKVANEDKNAQLEQDATLVKEIDEQDMDFQCMPEMEVQLSRQAELPDKFDDEEQKTFVQDVASSFWPLIAMWPVLYAGYQLEHMLGLVA